MSLYSAFLMAFVVAGGGIYKMEACLVTWISVEKRAWMDGWMDGWMDDGASIGILCRNLCQDFSIAGRELKCD